MSAANDVIAIEPVDAAAEAKIDTPDNPIDTPPSPARGLHHAGRVFAASFVGVGRGLYLFPLDTTFRTVGLRYGWL